jgi:flagellar hook-length control protein FliK
VPAGTTAGAAQPAGEAAAATPEATAQPASGAAVAQRAADKASPTATDKDPNQVAATHRQSPTVAPTETGKRPSGNAARDPQNNPQPGVTVATTTATVEARPAASLGGAAATAALAQQSPDGRAATPAENPPAPADASQPAAGNKTTAQPAQGGKTPEALAAMADKAAGAGQPSAPSAADTASATTGQPASPAAAAAGGVPGTGLVHNTGFAQALATARPNPAANPAEQIAIQVQRAQVAGQEKVTIKLHPAELGRIEVKLEHSSDGTLRAVLSAERPETLDLLQRDARGLERALQEAGLKTDSGSLNFSLRGQSHGQDQQAGGNDRAGHDGRDGTPEGANAEAMTAQAQQHRSSHSGTLDIQV